MKSPICEILGIDFPLLAFSHCRDVVAAVSRAGGMGVFGAVNLPPARLRDELTWIDGHCGGKPYGVDLIVPNSMEGKTEAFSGEALLAAVPQAHKDFASGILTSHGVEPGNLDDDRKRSVGFARNMRADGAASDSAHGQVTTSTDTTTQTMREGSMFRPKRDAYQPLMASRSAGRPVACVYWLRPARMARSAAAMTAGGAVKSGSPMLR